MTVKSWGELIAGTDLVELQIVHIFGVLSEFIDRDDAPEEWTNELKTAGRYEGDRLYARVSVEVTGPGGEITVDGIAIFESQFPWGDAEQDDIARFLALVGHPAIIPTVRATYEDTRIKLGLEDAPRFGLVKIPQWPTAGVEGVEEESEEPSHQ